MTPNAHASASSARPPDRLLAAIIECSDDAIISQSLDGIITSWNSGARKVFGYSAEDAIGRAISMIIPPEKGEEEQEILHRLRRGERLEHFETTRVRKDGKRIEVSLTISPIFDEAGNLVGAAKIARDITAAKLAREQLWHERERLRVTLSSIGDAVIVSDEQGVVQFMNPVAEALTGWPQAEAVGQRLEAVFPIVNESTRQRVENPAVRALIEGQPVPLANHTLLISRSGAELAIDDSAAPIRNESGMLGGVVMVFRDVTARRAVQDNRARLSAIVEGSDDAIVGKDLEGRITSWNRGAEQIFGYTQEEAVGRSITMLIPPDRLGEEAEILRRLRRGEKVDHFETVRLTKDQRLVDVSVTISPIRDADGNVMGASKIARDITWKKKAEQELQEAGRRLKRHAEELAEQVAARTAQLEASLQDLEVFSASLTHDLKAPLRAICGQAEILASDFGQTLPGEAQRLVLGIAATSSRLGRFVDNVLAYARLRGQTPALGRVELNDLVPRVIDEYSCVRQAGAQVSIEHPLLPVQAHDALLCQTIANLVSNAVKFVAPGTRPELRIWTESRGDRVRLWIVDNGIGIAEADQARVFDLFARGLGSEQYTGSGVGLAVVRRAVRRMGGEVGLESEPGNGSRFWVELPAAETNIEGLAAA